MDKLTEKYGEVPHDWEEEYLMPGGELESQLLFSRYHRFDSEELSRWNSEMEAEWVRVEEIKEAEKRAMEEEDARGGGKNWEGEWELHQWRARKLRNALRGMREEHERRCDPWGKRVPFLGPLAPWLRRVSIEQKLVSILKEMREEEAWKVYFSLNGYSVEERIAVRNQWKIPIGEVKVWCVVGTEGSVWWRSGRVWSGDLGLDGDNYCRLWGKKHGDWEWTRFREGGDIMEYIGELVSLRETEFDPCPF